jgi:hypothetical protein
MRRRPRGARRRSAREPCRGGLLAKSAPRRVFTNLYEDADGESHFRDIEVDWVEETPSGKMSKRLAATGIVFRETTADYENSWHRAPRRQYVISLAGGISITASDGETRHIGAGEIVLVEDTTGKGHITRSSGDRPRHTIFAPID